MTLAAAIVVFLLGFATGLRLDRFFQGGLFPWSELYALREQVRQAEKMRQHGMD